MVDVSVVLGVHVDVTALALALDPEDPEDPDVVAALVVKGLRESPPLASVRSNLKLL